MLNNHLGDKLIDQSILFFIDYQLVGKTLHSRCVTLVAAACLKLNTKEALNHILTLVEACQRKGNFRYGLIGIIY